MSKPAKVMLTLLLCFALSSCVLHNSQVKVEKFSHLDKNQKSLIFLNANWYESTFSIALVEAGIHVKEIPLEGVVKNEVKEKHSSTSLTYESSNAPYALKLETEPTSWSCFANDSRYIHATAEIIDLRKGGELVMAVKQSGADKKCPTYLDPPIWKSMAKAISENWN